MTRLLLPNSVPALPTDRNWCDDTTITTKFSASFTVMAGIGVMTHYHYQIQCQLYCHGRNWCDDTTITTKFSASSTVLTGIAMMYREQTRKSTLDVYTGTKDGVDYSLKK